MNEALEKYGGKTGALREDAVVEKEIFSVGN